MREVRDGARHAGIVEGQSGPVSDLCWRYLGVVKAGEIKAGHLLGTFEFQPSLVGTRSPNQEGVIGPSLVIGKLRLVRINTPATLHETNAHPIVQWTSRSARLLRLTTTLSCFGNISRKSVTTTIG